MFKKQTKTKNVKNYRTENNKLAYSVSQVTYNGTNNKYHKHLEDSGYLYDKELSKEYKVYHNSNTKKSIIGYKGTTSYNDVLIDIDGIALNNFEHPEFIKANDIYAKVKDKYGDNILTTGHSLGSTTAIKIAKKNDTNSISFSPGTSPLYKLNANDKNKVYRQGNDQISRYITGNVENIPVAKKAIYGLGNDTPLYFINQLDDHSLQNFDDTFF